jgi:hypothetical protein
VRSITSSVALAAILVACSASTASTDPNVPACEGYSAVGLATEQTPAGQCPSSPMMLTGTLSAYSACSQATDCAPFRCDCSGTGDCAFVAQCSNGTCLDGANTCCLYSQQCGQ